MPFIRFQKIKKNPDGSIASGSASIIDTIYCPNAQNPRNHSKQVTREKLGKVIWMEDDKKSGIFLSPTRGVVSYSSSTDEFETISSDDPRVQTSDIFPEPAVHTVFGDVYLLLEFMKKEGFNDIFKSLFSEKEQYDRLMCHILHTICRSGSRIDCLSFIEKSFASYLFKEAVNTSLYSDTRYFDLMGQEKTKMKFFKLFAAQMRKKYPEFGKACFVDSTPLPNDIQNNILNAMCSHGLTGSEKQTRMVLVLDEATGLPVWFKLINGNVLDMNTLREITSEVESSLGIEIESYVLDAGYLTQELIEKVHIGTRKTIIAKCPNRRGYHFNTVYAQNKDAIHQSKYDFVRKDHTYFGKRVKQTYFGKEEYAYVYVDRDNALTGYREFQLKNPKEFAEMSDKDKNWRSISSGFFILISNKEMEPKELLDKYFERTNIEEFFKTSKEYLGLLPLSKWSLDRFNGKLLNDVICTIIWKQLQKELAQTGRSVDKLLGQTSSLMGSYNRAKGNYTVETPRKQVKEIYQNMKIKIPNSIKVESYSKKMTNQK